MKIVKPIALLVVLAACFLGGLYGGPLVRSEYAKIFPPPAFVTGDYGAIYAAAGKRVVLYSTSTCPYCKKVRALFATNHVDYKDLVIDKSDSASASFKELKGGPVPMIFIGNRKIIGFNEKVIMESVRKSQKEELDRNMSRI